MQDDNVVQAGVQDDNHLLQLVNAPQDYIVAEQVPVEYDPNLPIPFDQIKIEDDDFIVPEPTHIRRTPDVEIPAEVHQQQIQEEMMQEQDVNHVYDELEAMMTDDED